MTTTTAATTTTQQPPPPTTPPNNKIVLYRDHSSHYAPLSHTYHATASRHLSSSLSHSLPLHPTSTATEVDTCYCPQCLTNNPSGTTTNGNGGYCPRIHCRLCPICDGRLSVTMDDDEEEEGRRWVGFFKCGYCRWTSRECGVDVRIDHPAAVDDDDDDGATTAVANAIVEALTAVDDRRRKEVEGEEEDLFRSLVDRWRTMARDEKRRQQAIAMNVPPPKPRSTTSSTLLVDGIVGRSSRSNDNTTTANLLPRRIPLRSKKSRRCRKELAAGRTGILVKPKVHPLEGDSSLRSGHGKWWKKDSSAVHVVPRITLLRSDPIDLPPDYPGAGRHFVLLLKIKNPTIGPVRLRCRIPTSSSADDDTSFDYPTTLLLPDDGSTTEQYGRPRRIAPRYASLPSSSILETPLATLHPAEDDAFLMDLRRTATATTRQLGNNDDGGDVPGVEEWNAAEEWLKVVMERRGDDEVMVEGHVAVVAERDDCAWVRVIVSCDDGAGEGSNEECDDDDDGGGGDKAHGEHDTGTSSPKFWALPLVMSVEVGRGSWESSFIKPKTTTEQEIDMVDFDTLVVWET